MNKQDTLLEHYIKDLDNIDTTHGNVIKDHHPDWFRDKRTVPVSLVETDLSRKVWLWSDPHFMHSNIIKYSKRPFIDLDDMHHMMISKYNELVQPDDIVIWGGDIGFGDKEYVEELVDQCYGYKILIIGNHDMKKKGILHNYVNKFDEVHPCLSITREGIEFWITHYPLDSVPVGVVNLHGHTHTECLQDFNFNYCVEQLNYQPINLTDMIIRADRYLNTK
jgi:calcineurin-like phosphoesterase family protein